MEMITTTRRYELDWLRVIAFGLLIFYHTGMIFVSWDFHIKNYETSLTMEIFMTLVNRWRLPLLFLVSGAGSYFALGKRTMNAFALERTKRLLIPLIFGMLVIVPPQIYFEHLQKGSHQTFLDFYSSVFNFVPYPVGSLSWHHMWFIAYLFVFSLICIPVFRFLRSDKGAQWLDSLEVKLSGAKVFLLLLPAYLLNLLLDPFFPTTHDLLHDWANFTVSLYIFIIGYILASREKIMDSVCEQRRIALIGGILFTSIHFILWFANIYATIPNPHLNAIIQITANFFMGSFMLLAVLGYARKFLTMPSKFLSYANRAVYPFYILHQTVIICVGYYIIKQEWGVWPKFFFISEATFVITLVLYEIIKRVAVLRLLFGVKPLPPKEP